MISEQFQTVGRDLFARGLVSSNSGNLSIRLGEQVIITRRGGMLNCLSENDLIETGVCKNSRSTPLASTDLNIHRAIYRETQALAIVHAHPPHAVALSLTDKEITPSGEDFPLIGPVPVVGWSDELEKECLADIVARALKEHHIIMVHNHGSFAIGQLLEEAYNLTTALEHSSQVLCLTKSFQVGPVQD
ncbi:MAG: aldolase [Gammaproteobacteria bacterium]|nr:aldolase [Gammaproteobacteria bacterium]NIO61354.1 aldolase [Gammaproteobacteria bacterium]